MVPGDRIVWTSALVIFLALIVATPAPAGTRTPARAHACSRAGSRTLSADSFGRLYLYPAARRFDSRRQRYVVPRPYACAYGTGRSFQLLHGDFPQEDAYGPLKLNGRFLGGAVIMAAGAGAFEPQLFVQDIRDAQIVRLIGVPDPTTLDSLANFSQSLPALLVSRRGSLAWITRTSGVNLTVRTSAGAGPHASALMDSGPQIEATSLRLASGLLHWTNAGIDRSAPLP